MDLLKEMSSTPLIHPLNPLNIIYQARTNSSRENCAPLVVELLFIQFPHSGYGVGFLGALVVSYSIDSGEP